MREIDTAKHNPSDIYPSPVWQPKLFDSSKPTVPSEIKDNKAIQDRLANLGFTPAEKFDELLLAYAPAPWLSPHGKAENYLNNMADDPRRDLTPKQRDTLKAMHKAVLSGDVAGLEKIVKLFDGNRDEGGKLARALGRDLKDAGLSVNYWGSFGGGEDSYYLAIHDSKSGADLKIATAGTPTEAKIGEDNVKPKDAFAKMGKTAVDSINKRIKDGPEKLDPDVQSLLDKWKEAHSSPKADKTNTFKTGNGDTLTDNGDGTCTVKGLLEESKGTVKKDPKTGDVTYSLPKGVTVTRSSDGKIVTKTPERKHKIGDTEFTDPAETTTTHLSGLEIRDDGKTRRVKLPNGTRITEGNDGKARYRDKYGDHQGKATKLEDGSTEYFFDDGRQVFTVKKTGEVAVKSYDTTTIWAPDGAKAEIERSKEMSIKAEFKSTKGKDSFKAPNGFNVERTESGIKAETEKGTYEFDEDGNLKFTGKDGKAKEYKVADAEKVTYGGGRIVELHYPDGTAITIAGKDIYTSFSGPGKSRHNFWMEGGNSTVYYQLGKNGHSSPDYYPMGARGR